MLSLSPALPRSPSLSCWPLLLRHATVGLDSSRAALGLPSEQEFVDRYVEGTGLVSVREHFDYYLALACFRVAAATAARPEPSDDELRFGAQMAGAGVGCAQRYEKRMSS